MKDIFKIILWMLMLLFVFVSISTAQNTFYSQGGISFTDRNNWNTQPDGSGIRASNGDFVNQQNTFIIQPGDSMSVDGRVRSITLIVNGDISFETDDFSVSDSLIINSGGSINPNGFTIDLQTVVVIIDDNAEYIQPNGGELLLPFETLPVELVQFMAYAIERNFIEIKWITATERNNWKFKLFRKPYFASTDSLKLIKEIEGKGNSDESIIYTVVDTIPNHKYSYSYVLKQIDYDGKETIYTFEYKSIYDFSIESVFNSNKNSEFLNLYPNPVNGNFVTVTYYSPYNTSKETNMLFVDILGRTLSNNKVISNYGWNQYRADIQGFATGSYVLIIISEGYILTNKLIILK